MNLSLNKTVQTTEAQYVFWKILDHAGEHDHQVLKILTQMNNFILHYKNE